MLYLVGGIVALGPAGLSGRRAAQAGDVLMTANGFSSSSCTSSSCSRWPSRSAPTWRGSTRARPFGLDRVARPARAADLSALRASGPTRRWAGRPTRSPCCCSTWRACSSSTPCSALQGVLPLNPQGFGAVSAGLVVQHRGQLRHQHQLAGLRRRDDDELPDPDARAHRAELRLGGQPAWPCWWR